MLKLVTRKNVKRKIFLLFLITFITLFSLNFALASQTDGTIDSTYKYAWSENIGWLNFGASGGNVHITDDELTGYVWNNHFGWINLQPANSGVKNDAEGNLSGYAWGKGVGWINFGGVEINQFGIFTGKAYGANTGWINFDCSNCQVKTDWRPQSTRGTQEAEEEQGTEEEQIVGGAPRTFSRSTSFTPSTKFSIKINQGDLYTTSSLVVLNLTYSSDIKKVALSNLPDFKKASQISPQKEIKWDLCKDQEEICQKINSFPEGFTFYVFAKFYDQYGYAKTTSDSIILDKTAPKIEIEGLRAFYLTDEEIILKGSTEKEVRVILESEKEYIFSRADQKGSWQINLGRLSPGRYSFQISSQDLAGNLSSPLEISFEVKKKKVGLIGKIKEFFKKIGKKEKEKPIVVIPKVTPSVFEGKWSLLPEKGIEEFVFAPLPKEIQSLTEKFPELKRTFQKIGLKRFSDILSLKSVELTLPGLTKKVGLPLVKIRPGKFALPKGVALKDIPLFLKEKIPPEVVFVRSLDEKIDLEPVFTLDREGKIQEKISLLARVPIKLVVKPKEEVKKIKGYLIFKSSESLGYQQEKFETDSQASNFKFQDLFASLVFAQPILTQPAKKVKYIALENSRFSSSEELSRNFASEKRLVLKEFEYKDPDKDNIYTAQIFSPQVAGEYEIVTIFEYQKKEIGKRENRLIAVVDPEGYVYEKTKQGELRVEGAIVSLFWLDKSSNSYQLWPAEEYQQRNPQVTNETGRYSFLVPEGYYYLKVTAPGYLPYQSDVFKIDKNKGIHFNIELKRRGWWLRVVDWRTILLILVAVLLLYNFYCDKIRDRARKHGV